ncbi:MAG: AmmeMemoRadiSam system protein B [bacterium]
MIRPPAVAGYFYPGDPHALRSQVQAFLQAEDAQGARAQRAIALVSPHAGYIYSGSVAASAFSRVKLPSKFFILSPNHTGEGALVALNKKGKWATPLGEAAIDSDLAEAFSQRCEIAEEDSLAHRAEHSLEVQIPFLQVLKKDFRFVPLTLHHLSYELCEKIGEELAETIRASGEEVLIVASSDMNHYESQETTMRKDQIAIDPILQLNPKALYEQVHRHRVSMCGIIPTTVALVAAKRLGAKTAELIRHATSGDVSRDYDRVVGYASFILR